MSEITDYLENLLLNWLFTGGSLTAPQTWAALATAAPTEAGVVTGEPTIGGYARKRVFQDGATAPFWDTPAEVAEALRVTNNALFQFPINPGGSVWGNISHVLLLDASSAGNLLLYSALDTTVNVAAPAGDDGLEFAANALKVDLLCPTDYIEDKIIKHLFRATAYTPEQTWLGALTTAPDASGSGAVEVSGGSYARQRIFQDGTTSPYWTLGAGALAGAVRNTQDIYYPQATADWGEIVAVGVYTASSGGNLSWAANLPTKRFVARGSTLRLFANEIVLAIA